jgi:hypothetical protein
MTHLNNKKKNYDNRHNVIAAATTSILAIAIMVASTSMASPIAAATSNATNATTTTIPSASSPSAIKLSPQPVLREQATTLSMTPINQTHMNATFSGDGTLILPNTTETIIFTTNGSALISLTTQSAQAKETIVTEDGETATATFYEIQQFNPATAGEGKGITIAVIHTDSNGTLASLNGMILAGIDDVQPNGESRVTLWEWESGISNSGLATPPTQEGSLTNTTTTSELPPPVNTP